LALAGRAQTTPDDVVATRSGHVLLITGTMAKWCKQAGIPVANKREGKHGYTLHGLRKNFGIELAEDGATGPAFHLRRHVVRTASLRGGDSHGLLRPRDRRRA
jgi:hypothetical protein